MMLSHSKETAPGSSTINLNTTMRSSTITFNNSVFSMNSHDTNTENMLLNALNIESNRTRLQMICAADPITKFGMRIQLCRMLSISVIPISIMMGFTAYMFGTNLDSSSDSSKINDNIYLATEITSLMHVLQKERDMSALYCSAIGPETKNFLITQYAITDDVLAEMFHWPFSSFGSSVSSRLTTKEKFISFLNRHRYQLEVRKPNSKDELEFYTTITEVFIQVLYHIIQSESKGTLWKTLASMLEIVKCRESFGIERALGTVFFVEGGFFDRDGLLWFLQSQDQGNQTLKMAVGYSTDVSDIYNEILLESESITIIIREMRYLIRESKLKVLLNETEAHDTIDGSTLMASWWFGNMTIYLDTLYIMQTRLIEKTVQRLSEIESEDEKFLIAIGTIFATVILLTPVMIYSIYRLTKNIQSCSLTLATRTKHLSFEKTRTNTLLYQMLPQPVAEKLKINQPIEPVLFKSATVFFNDIVGFTALSARSSPMQVVDMMNYFFTNLDHVIAQYDVFKVETIGDAYMVASGLPEKNGNRHASEIGLLSLHILNELKGMQIPHMPRKKFHVRIGCHTGPVIAGVVGIKMPRYCLFGATVTIAAKMESTGIAGCIQVSEATNQLLTKTGSFITQERTDAVMDEKTYWLLHQRGSILVDRKFSDTSGSDNNEEFASRLHQDLIKKYPEELSQAGESVQEDVIHGRITGDKSVTDAEITVNKSVADSKIMDAESLHKAGDVAATAGDKGPTAEYKHPRYI